MSEELQLFKRCFVFYSSQIEFFYQANRKSQIVDNTSVPIPGEQASHVTWKS